MKANIKKIGIWLLFVIFCLNGYGQIVEENRYLARTCVSGLYGYSVGFQILAEFLQIAYGYIDVSSNNCNHSTAFYVTPSQYPSTVLNISYYGSRSGSTFIPFCHTPARRSVFRYVELEAKLQLCKESLV